MLDFSYYSFSVTSKDDNGYNALKTCNWIRGEMSSSPDLCVPRWSKFLITLWRDKCYPLVIHFSLPPQCSSPVTKDVHVNG